MAITSKLIQFTTRSDCVTVGAPSAAPGHGDGRVVMTWICWHAVPAAATVPMPAHASANNSGGPPPAHANKPGILRVRRRRSQPSGAADTGWVAQGLDSVQAHHLTYISALAGLPKIDLGSVRSFRFPRRLAPGICAKALLWRLCIVQHLIGRPGPRAVG
jgi:hypothetical protein